MLVGCDCSQFETRGLHTARTARKSNRSLFAPRFSLLVGGSADRLARHVLISTRSRPAALSAQLSGNVFEVDIDPNAVDEHPWVEHCFCCGAFRQNA